VDGAYTERSVNTKNKMWSLRFPREIGTPKRRMCKTKEEYLDYIRHAIRLTNLYTTVYNFSELIRFPFYQKIDYDSAIVDRLYFDCDFKVKGEEVDGYISMLKLHEWCEENGNIKHQCYFTGSAYSVILAVTHDGLENKRGAVYNAQQALLDKLDIVTDPQVMGDLARITRIPNTFNFKKTARRYAIPLKEEQIYLGDKVIREIAKKQQFGVKPMGTGTFNITDFDCAPVRKAPVDVSTFSFDDVSDDAKEILGKFENAPPCVKRMLADEDLGYNARRILIVWLRDQGLLLDETMAVLKETLSDRKYKHSVFEERQPQYLYRRMLDMYFPKCRSIADRGYCDCETENECGLR